MKKSEVLKVLGDYVINYTIEEFLNAKWLTVEVEALTAYHMLILVKTILSIDATNDKTMKINFRSTIEID